MERNYIIVTDEHINTGGGCMVSMFTVYDQKNNVTRYLFVNDECANWATADILSADIIDSLEADINDLLIYSYYWQDLIKERLTESTIDKELMELMIDCGINYFNKIGQSMVDAIKWL